MHLKFTLKSNTEFWFLVLHVSTLKLPLCPKKEKLNRKTKQNNTSQVCKTEKDIRQTTASKTGETEQWSRLISDQCYGNQCWGRKSWTVIDELLEAHCGWCWDSPAGAPPDLHSKYQKSPKSFQQEEGKKNHFKIREHTVFNRVCPQEKLVKQSLTCQVSSEPIWPHHPP